MKEKELKQKVIEALKNQGWEYKPYSELEKSPDDFILKNIFFKKIREINRNIELTEKDLNEVLTRLINAGRKEALRFIKERVPIVLEKYKYKKTIRLIDYKNNNNFIVSEEVIFRRGNNTIKADIVLFVNGIPLAMFEVEELKEDEWKAGFQQLFNYFKNITQLFNIVQIGSVIADAIYYFPFDRDFEVKKREELEERKLYIWKPFKERKTKDWRKIFSSTFSILFNPYTFLEVIKYFTFYKRDGSKIIPRYYQYYTAKSIYEKIKERLMSKSKERSWTVWHYQGTGKTLTMIYLMYMIFKRLSRELSLNPLVLFIVDRIELQDQILKEFIEKLDLDLDIEPKIIASFNDLLDISPGAYVLLIQKFREKEKIEEVPEKIKNKKDVFIFIDEAHRSHYGELNKRLNEVFKEAFYIAFTGTPLLKKDKNTFLKFGKPIDIYFIEEGEADGYILPIYYKAVYDIIEITSKFIDKNLYKEIMQKVFKGEIDEDFEEIEKIDKKIKRKVINLRRLVFENDERIKEISKRIAEHFKNELMQKGFKALLIVASRKAAIKYKKYLSKEFKEGEVEAVITYNLQEDTEDILNYYREIVRRYTRKGIKDPDEINKIIVEKFKEEENPKILIVVNKLITGFDEPKIQTIYIDRFLSEHTLLQAIGRCNRKYKEIKKNGLIMDFVGIVEELKKAYALYYGEKEIAGIQRELIIKDAELIEKRLEEILNTLDENVFKELGMSLKDFMNKFKRDPKNVVNNILTKMFSSSLTKIFIKYFKEFEYTLFSPVASELKQLKLNEFYKKYKMLRVIYDSISASTEGKLEISELDRIVDAKIRKILEELYSNTLIKEILESEKKSFEKIKMALKSESYIEIKELLQESISYSQNENVNREKLAKLVKTLTLIKKTRKELYGSLIDKILRKIEKYNKKKIEAFKILQEISKDVEKIIETEKIRAKVKDIDTVFIYERLLDMLGLKDIKIAEKIRSDIKKAEEFIKRNDFCKILNRRIRIAVKKHLRNISNEQKLEEILLEVKKYYAGRYKECERELLR